MPGAEDKDKGEGAGAGAEDKDPKDGEGTGAGADDGGADGEGASFKTVEEAAAEIAKLRKENAKNRIKNKGLEGSVKSLNDKFDALKKAFGGEDDEKDPEEKVKDLQSQNQALALELSVSKLSKAHEIPAAQDKYFKFLLAEKFESLKDGEEVSDEDIAAIAAEVKKVSATAGAAASTSVGAGKKKDADNGAGAMTVEQFVKMNVGEKSQLYTKNPAEYNRLFSSAKEKRLL